jgi:hypothetical protein
MSNSRSFNSGTAFIPPSSARINGDCELIDRLRQHGVEVLSVQHFLDKLDAGGV